MVLVVLFPLPDEKNVDVKTIFTCSQTCLLEMKLRALSLFRSAQSCYPANGPGARSKAGGFGRWRSHTPPRLERRRAAGIS